MSDEIKPAKVYVICAAVKVGDQVFLGRDHADIIKNIGDANPGIYIRQDMQGFMLNTGQFAMRPAAHFVAFRAGQIKEKNAHGVFLSEDIENRLWQLCEIRGTKK